jgi:hypothetical protein
VARKAQRGDRAARQAKVREIADVLRDAEPTPFALQAACTHAIRAKLCLDGWPYTVAHAEADKLVKAALDLVGAKRPSWAQGQPEWTQEGVRTRERTTCARCARPLPEGHFKWCSHNCKRAAGEDKWRQQNRQEFNAKQRAYRAAWSAKQPSRACAECGTEFKPKSPTNPNAKHCSVRCRNRANARKNKDFGTIRKMGT